jgi:hypothetical protein
MKTYSDKLKDPRWQRKRLEILQRDDFACRYCRSKDNTLHVHHKLYRKGKMPWDYEDDVFVTLCESCHKTAEDSKEAVLIKMGSSRYRDLSLYRIATALDEDPTEVTFLGWAASNLAACVNAQLSLEEGVDESEEFLEGMHEEFRSNMAECIENLHHALFLFKQRFPI